jgi:mannose-6-phosphate isomerase-like protein (cupin superfamily)
VPRSGDSWNLPALRARYVFRVTAGESDGRLLALDVLARPGWSTGPEHAHTRQVERFDVVSGTLAARVAGRKSRYGAGETIRIDPGVPHRLWNPSRGDAQLKLELRPAGRGEELLSTLLALARDGRAGRWGIHDPLRAAVILDEYRDEQVLTKRPLSWLSALAPFARRLGYRPVYP